jgi:hypothetical protein
MVIFQIGSCIFAGTGLDLDLSTYSSHVAAMTGVYHHDELFIG